MKPRKLIITYAFPGPDGKPYVEKWPVDIDIRMINIPSLTLSGALAPPIVANVETRKGSVRISWDKVLHMRQEDYGPDEICPKCESLNVVRHTSLVSPDRGVCLDCSYGWEIKD